MTDRCATMKNDDTASSKAATGLAAALTITGTTEGPKSKSNPAQGAAKKARKVSKMIHRTVAANVETKLRQHNRKEPIFRVKTKNSERGAKGRG